MITSDGTSLTVEESVLVITVLEYMDSFTSLTRDLHLGNILIRELSELIWIEYDNAYVYTKYKNMSYL